MGVLLPLLLNKLSSRFKLANSIPLGWHAFTRDLKQPSVHCHRLHPRIEFDPNRLPLVFPLLLQSVKLLLLLVLLEEEQIKLFVSLLVLLGNPFQLLFELRNGVVLV